MVVSSVAVPPIPWAATTAAASVEVFYRSALNSKINQVLTGARTALFPQMHVQLPVRVAYINGFKALRVIIDDRIDETQYNNTTAVRAVKAILPGVIMTPVSSILEACHVNNSKPLHLRWMDGVQARGVREVIFGIGLNQLSDNLSNATPSNWHPSLRNAGGSVIAGVIAGYLSHVPHNLSVMKLVSPQTGYMALLSQLSQPNYEKLSAIKSQSLRRVAAAAWTLIAPRGVMVRTTQIVGSFVILNGLITIIPNVLGNSS
jgi:hypothetical protein